MIRYWTEKIRSNIARIGEVPELYRENVRAAIEEM